MADTDLDAAIKKADARAPVFGDTVDFENAAIFKWLRAHEFHGGGMRHLAIGTETLPAAWQSKCLKLHDIGDARAVIARAAKDPHGKAMFRRLYTASGGTATVDDAALKEALAVALTSGALWAMEVERIPPQPGIKTDPAAFTRINAALGTAVDFAFIAELEGDQWQSGYVPLGNSGIVAGKSGMTIATGFDIGQWSEADLVPLKLPKELVTKLKPFTAPNNFRGKNRAEVIAAVALLGPVPQISKAEADTIDEAVMTALLKTAIKNWNKLKGMAVPAFVGLPSGWQTVWLSRTFQEGPNTVYGPGFGKAARAGDWTDAIAKLKASTEYKSRKLQEAKLLEAALPAEVKKPKAAAPAVP